MPTVPFGYNEVQNNENNFINNQFVHEIAVIITKRQSYRLD